MATRSWPSGAKKVPQADGSKAICYKEGDLCLIDKFWTNDGNRDGEFRGETVIQLDGQVVWMMVYRGVYEERALGCLRTALLEAYRRNVFCGGRGPSESVYDGCLYRNTPKPNSNFASFRGCEVIQDQEDGKPLGYATYEGGLVAIA